MRPINNYNIIKYNLHNPNMTYYINTPHKNRIFDTIILYNILIQYIN